MSFNFDQSFKEFEGILSETIESNNVKNRNYNTRDSVLEDCLVNLEGNISDVIPSESTLEITLNYEETFLGSFNGNHDEALAAIATTLTHAQAVFFDESLQTRMALKVPFKNTLKTKPIHVVGYVDY